MGHGKDRLTLPVGGEVVVRFEADPSMMLAQTGIEV